jgi:hypothetical protein
MAPVAVADLWEVRLLVLERTKNRPFMLPLLTVDESVFGAQ